MRGIQIPATAPRFALALLATSVVVGCGTAPRPDQPGTAIASTAKAASPTPAASNTGGAASTRLDVIAFTSPAAGYGVFTQTAPGRCQILAGRTTDGGARFGTLTHVTTWQCGENPPASFLATDGHGDAFLFDPGLFVTHDGGQAWVPVHQPGTVLAVATAGRSAWMVRADCLPHGQACQLRLLESANGGQTWTATPAQPAGATVPEVGGQPGQEGAAGQTWLLRTGRSSAYVLSSPAGDVAPVWFTADGGATWSARQVRCGVAARSVTLAAAPDGTLLAVCAGQPGMGFQAKSAAQSVNGGRSWAVHAPCPPAHLICRRAGPLDFGYLAQIATVSPGTAFLVGGRSSLLVTTDGGSHWRTVRPPLGDTSGGTSQVIFVNRRDGFAVGDDFRNGERPTIWRTTDGGRRWSGMVPRP